MAKRETESQQLDFAFFTYLQEFYIENRGMIRNHYRSLTKKFIDFNNPENPHAFLRDPQFEALEMYVFLKEFLENAHVHQIFEDWYENKGKFEKAKQYGSAANGQMRLLFLDEKNYQKTFAHMKKFAQDYPNYIFALTMGTGKTILMATCIFYEFLLANKFPKDPKYIHNALVFAPDKTVLESLKEIQTFDKRKVVPPEYMNVLDSHLKIHFLEDTGSTLNTLDHSRFNIIVSNTQKIILKRQHKEKSKVDQLFEQVSYDTGSVYEEHQDLYDFDTVEDEGELLVNQRFLKLTRLKQLGIYVDEAHHSFGNALAKDMGVKKAKTSLRLTINELANNLEKAGTSVVGCYNYTGTPYIGKEVLPEVVYAYHLRTAINKGYLKEVSLHGYTNPKTLEFVRLVIKDFWTKYNGKRYEGMLPKLALFASKIDEIQNELRPAVEEVLNEMGIPLTKILVNVGDPKHTTNDDIREFNRLDSPGSDKQIILLVNKGREGWNCRSLFGVGLYRKPRSKIFVLQATMRCLRAIGPVQERANVYLSDENMSILEDELQQNFRISTEELQTKNDDKKTYKVKLVPPPVRVPVKRIRKLYQLKEKFVGKGLDLELDKIEEEKYKLIHTVQEGLMSYDTNVAIKEDLSSYRVQRKFSSLTLVAEISRYLNRSCIEIEELLHESVQGMDEILNYVNQHNEILYDWIIPRLFKEIYEVKQYDNLEEEELELVKEPEEGYYQLRAKPDLVSEYAQDHYAKYSEKSFHMDTYCFDSKPEKRFFDDVLSSGDVKEIYFTGMLTHGQSDFYVQYIDPDSHTVRSYYPDFLIKKKDDTWMIIEVKGDNKIEDPIVLAKERSANEMASASRMTYKMVKGSDIMAGLSRSYIAANNEKLNMG